MKNPLVSVIVPTKNSAATLAACLRSIAEQTFDDIELIVVDNFSSDETPAIARTFTEHFFQAGPERSAQVNYAVSRARGSFIYKVDSDFVLDPTVIEECVIAVQEGADAVVVHNTPDTRVSWIARIRKFEVDMYRFDLDHASARFVSKQLFQKIGGFSDSITAGEDYDFQNRLNRAGASIAFINAEAIHLGEPTSFWKHMFKYYAYGVDFTNYLGATSKKESRAQLRFLRRAYIRNWREFLRRPVVGLIFIIYHVTKYAFGGVGAVVGTIRKRHS